MNKKIAKRCTCTHSFDKHISKCWTRQIKLDLITFTINIESRFIDTFISKHNRNKNTILYNIGFLIAIECDWFTSIIYSIDNDQCISPSFQWIIQWFKLFDLVFDKLNVFSVFTLFDVNFHQEFLVCTRNMWFHLQSYYFMQFQQMIVSWLFDRISFIYKGNGRLFLWFLFVRCVEYKFLLHLI